MVAMQMLFGLTMFVYSFNSRKFVLKNSLIEILCLLLPFKGLQFILISNRQSVQFIRLAAAARTSPLTCVPVYC